jgi:hypothetical protein
MRGMTTVKLPNLRITAISWRTDTDEKTIETSMPLEGYKLAIPMFAKPKIIHTL